MPALAEFVRRNRAKVLIVVGFVILAFAFTVYSTSGRRQPDQQLVLLQDYPSDVQDQIKAANKTAAVNSSLVFATVIFRHGDRNPTNPYKTDPYADGNSYVGGWGSLTLKGKRRMYLLGLHLRQRYSNLVPPLYIPEQLYVLSSDADRCIMSAECFLAALYPPLPFQKIHPNLDWQPIPVHTIPRELDKMVGAKSDCPRYSEALKCIYNGSLSSEINANSSSLLQMLTEKSGQPVVNYAQAESLYNTVALQKTLGLNVPDWATDEVLAHMKELAITSLSAFTQTPFMRKIRGGPLLKEIRKNIENTKSGKSRMKLFVVSGHDLTLINILRTLGFTDRPWKPEFSGSLLIELHKFDQEYQVQLWFNNGYEVGSVFSMLKLAGCDYSCPLGEFLDLTQDVVPVTWQEDCTSGSPDPDACSKM